MTSIRTRILAAKGRLQLAVLHVELLGVDPFADDHRRSEQDVREHLLALFGD
jgi:hypothetical protein